MITKDKYGSYVYISKKTSKTYYLFKGITNNGIDSDLLFIFDYEKSNVVGFMYGGFCEDTLNGIERYVEIYENK